MARDRIDLPRGFLSNELHIACERRGWIELENRLKSDAPNESCAFALTWPSRGTNRTTVTVRNIIWPLPGDVRATPKNLEISSNYISRALDAAIDAGSLCGIALIHTHPDTQYGAGIGQFSTRDNWYEARLFPTFTRPKPKSLCASIVLGSRSGDVDARVWWEEKGESKTQAAQIIRIVGPELSFLETPYSVWRDHLDPEVMNRSTRLWGLQGRRRLQNMRIGIVGAGGTGSIMIMALASMGVGGLRIWDKDVVKKENLHRMLGVAKGHLGVNKAEALAMVAKQVSTASPFCIEQFPYLGTSEQALMLLKDCDMVLSCVDRLSARDVLNEFSYAHLIPGIDMASSIHSANGQVDAISTHAHVWSPGIPCAWCRQTLSSYKLMREAQGLQKGIEARVPYGLTAEETDGVEPSVLALNMMGVSLALMQFMQVALGITGRTPRDLKFFLPEWELDESDLNTEHGCKTEAQSGLADSVRIVLQ